jgi:flavin-dependent dehydrogenase
MAGISVNNPRNSTDVLIVGGGPAGLAAALALRQRGATVTVADARKPPIDKACGEGLMPDSLHALAQLGVELLPSDGAAFHGIRFVNHEKGRHSEPHETEVATAQFPSGARFGSGLGVGLRRQTLHARLVAQAEAAGVDLRWQSQVQLMEDGRVLVAGEVHRYACLVGADGQGSRVRHWAGLDECKVLSRRFGFRQHFRVDPSACWSPFVEVHWAASGQAYVSPVGPGEVCVATLSSNQYCRVKTLLEELPQLRKRLAGGTSSPTTPLDTERGSLTTTNRVARVAVGSIALIGDASGSVDAITGEGLGIAFRQALLLAECFEIGDLERYNRLHPEILRVPQTMARVMLLMDRSEAVRNRALHMLAAEPAIFARMLGVHLGSEPVGRFVATSGLEVAWRMMVQRQPSAAPGAPA